MGAIPPSELRRYTIGLESGVGALGAAGRGQRRAAADRLPAPQHPDYRFAYFTGMAGELARPLVKVDVGQGEVASWAEDGCYPGEPVFVREPGTEGEDDGVILSVVLDARAGRSFLLVLDAQSFGELARAEAPAPHPVRLPRAVPAVSAPRHDGGSPSAARTARRGGCSAVR